MKEVPRNFLKKKNQLNKSLRYTAFFNKSSSAALFDLLFIEWKRHRKKKREAFPPYAVYAKIFAKDFNQIFISLGLELGS